MSKVEEAVYFPRPHRFFTELYYPYCQLFSVGFVAAVVLQLDVQVQGHIRSVDPVALVVGTEEVLLDLRGQPPVFLAVFDAVETIVLVLKVLGKEISASIWEMSSVSCDFLSEISRMRAQLI